jgi:PleD family two-component response regulator
VTRNDRILLIADSDRMLQSALAEARPQAQVTSVPSVFHAIAELSESHYDTIFAPAESIERRPESAVRSLRDMAGQGRLFLFGHPTLEPLSRKMLEFGTDDYIITPPNVSELDQLLQNAPRLRLARTGETAALEPDQDEASVSASSSSVLQALESLPLAHILLDALLQHPHNAVAFAIEEINGQLPEGAKLILAKPASAPPPDVPGSVVLSHAIHGESEPAALVHLTVPAGAEQHACRHVLARISALLSKLHSLDERHTRLQRLAILDDLTGLYNGRYFKHFLGKITERARQMRFPVTLLLFDIDNFKRYNDLFGHGVGDEILRQTAALMRRCCRDHDLVARISGDEFAVVFWDKEGPRQPRDPRSASSSRVPQNIVQILERFRGLLSSPEFQYLGLTGKGVLTISGGLAVYPYDASTPEALIEAADRALMFGAKKSGKNSIYLVGGDESEPNQRVCQ